MYYSALRDILVPRRGDGSEVRFGPKADLPTRQLWEQAKKLHSDLMHKFGPLSGPLLYF